MWSFWRNGQDYRLHRTHREPAGKGRTREKALILSVLMVVALSTVSPISSSFLKPLPLAAQSSAVSLEGLMSAPFPSGLTPSPAGGLVAWVQNDQGVRNIWMAGPPEYRGRQLTSYTRDDGQEIGGLTWTVDGSTLFFIRGEPPTGRGRSRIPLPIPPEWSGSSGGWAWPPAESRSGPGPEPPR